MSDSTPAAAIPPVDRAEPAYAQSERDMLCAWLDYHRGTLQNKCAGLTAEQLATASCPPSNLTLLGLLRHLTDVERGWFARGSGRDAPPIYYSDDDPEGDFAFGHAPDDDEVRATFRRWREECDTSRSVVAALGSLDDTAAGESHTWRWIVTHMIEEYARHNGHADLIREAIDGATGE